MALREWFQDTTRLPNIDVVVVMHACVEKAESGGESSAGKGEGGLGLKGTLGLRHTHSRSQALSQIAINLGIPSHN